MSTDHVSGVASTSFRPHLKAGFGPGPHPNRRQGAKAQSSSWSPPRSTSASTTIRFLSSASASSPSSSMAWSSPNSSGRGGLNGGNGPSVGGSQRLEKLEALRCREDEKYRIALEAAATRVAKTREEGGWGRPGTSSSSRRAATLLAPPNRPTTTRGVREENLNRVVLRAAYPAPHRRPARGGYDGLHHSQWRQPEYSPPPQRPPSSVFDSSRSFAVSFSSSSSTSSAAAVGSSPGGAHGEAASGARRFQGLRFDAEAETAGQVAKAAARKRAAAEQKIREEARRQAARTAKEVARAAKEALAAVTLRAETEDKRRAAAARAEAARHAKANLAAATAAEAAAVQREAANPVLHPLKTETKIPGPGLFGGSDGGGGAEEANAPPPAAFRRALWIDERCEMHRHRLPVQRAAAAAHRERLRTDKEAADATRAREGDREAARWRVEELSLEATDSPQVPLSPVKAQRRPQPPRSPVALPPPPPVWPDPSYCDHKCATRLTAGGLDLACRDEARETTIALLWADRRRAALEQNGRVVEAQRQHAETSSGKCEAAAKLRADQWAAHRDEVIARRRAAKRVAEAHGAQLQAQQQQAQRKSSPIAQIAARSF